MIAKLNLGLRFVLELLALIAVGYWGFATQQDWLPRILCGVGVPLLMAVAWGAFRVPGDGGEPLVITPPRLRLLLEAVFFGLAVVLFYAAGQKTYAVVFLVVVLIHYGVDYRRTSSFLAGVGPQAPPG